MVAWAYRSMAVAAVAAVAVASVPRSSAAARSLLSPRSGRLFPAPRSPPPPQPSLLGLLGPLRLLWRARTPPPRRPPARTKPRTPTPTTFQKRRTTRRRRYRTRPSKSRRNPRRARLPPSADFPRLFLLSGHPRRSPARHFAWKRHHFASLRDASVFFSPSRGRDASRLEAFEAFRLLVRRLPVSLSGSGARSRSSARRARRRPATTRLRPLRFLTPFWDSIREGHCPFSKTGPPRCRLDLPRTRASPATTVPTPTFSFANGRTAESERSPSRPPRRTRRSRLAGARSPPPSRSRWA